MKRGWRNENGGWIYSSEGAPGRANDSCHCFCRGVNTGQLTQDHESQTGSAVAISSNTVGVEKKSAHSSPRVRDMILAVVMPERAVPRAPASQLSTGAGVSRRKRSVSNQTASSATWGAGSFSMAASISAMLLIARNLACYQHNCQQDLVHSPNSPAARKRTPLREQDLARNAFAENLCSTVFFTRLTVRVWESTVCQTKLPSCPAIFQP